MNKKLMEILACPECHGGLNPAFTKINNENEIDEGGLMCGHCRRTLGPGSVWELSGESRAIAADMLRRPVAQLAAAHWSQDTAADLRRFLKQQIESHMERRLITAAMLEEGLTSR